MIAHQISTKQDSKKSQYTITDKRHNLSATFLLSTVPDQD